MATRNFKMAANFLLDTVATFTYCELMDDNYFVKYKVTQVFVDRER